MSLLASLSASNSLADVPTIRERVQSQVETARAIILEKPLRKGEVVSTFCNQAKELLAVHK